VAGLSYLAPVQLVEVVARWRLPGGDVESAIDHATNLACPDEPDLREG
jgi:hypothetical protein